MDFSDTQYAQLIIALFGGIVLFVLVQKVSERFTLSLLILMTPFQAIDSKYGSLNLVLTYLVAGAFLLQGRLKKLPFLGPIMLILFTLLLAFSQGHPAARLHHIIYLAGFFSNILLFYLVYNYMLRTQDWKLVLHCLIALNVLVIVYLVIQALAGREPFMLFGIAELSMISVRPNGQLVGPFKATAATAEFLTIQFIIIAFLLIRTTNKRQRKLLISLLALDAGFLIATGNRGGFITFVLGSLLYLYTFRQELGFARIVKMVIVGGMLVTTLALVVVNLTPFGMLFERLEGTTVEGGVPDTRATVWPMALERISERPVLGHGPELFISSVDNPVADIPYMLYPHSLPLYILYTTGIVGLTAWTVFFWLMISRLINVPRSSSIDFELAAIPRVAVIVLIVFLVSQIRIEFLRGALADYQNYLFVLFAWFLACRDLIVRGSVTPMMSSTFGKSQERIQKDGSVSSATATDSKTTTRIQA